MAVTHQGVYCLQVVLYHIPGIPEQWDVIKQLNEVVSESSLLNDLPV